MDLFEYFKTKFKPGEIDKAKIWYKKWRDEWYQDIPGHPEFSAFNGYSCRSMAGHLSYYIEGKENDYIDDLLCYADTKYGSELFFI